MNVSMAVVITVKKVVHLIVVETAMDVLIRAKMHAHRAQATALKVA